MVMKRRSVPAYSSQSDTLPAALFQSSSKGRFVLEAGCAHRIREMTLAISVTVTGGAARLAPVPLWFDRIEFRADGGSNLVSTIYGDVLLASLASIDKERLPEVLRGANLSEDWKPLPSWAQNTTHTFHLPLVGSWIDAANIAWGHQKGDMHIEFHSNVPIVSGAGTVVLNSLDLILSSQLPSKIDQDTNVRLASDGSVRAAKFLSGHIQTFPSQTLTAGNSHKIKLDSFKGECAYLLLAIRDIGATNTANGLQRAKSLNGATIDLLTPSSQSILGRGTAISVDFLKRVVYPTVFPNVWIQKSNWYIVPFCDSVLAAIGGSQGHGYYTFEPNGASPYLEFGIPAAAVSAVDTVTMSANAAGFYRLSYKGHHTAPLAHTANVATIKAALEALPSMRDADGNPITVVASGGFNGGTRTITYTSDGYLSPDDLIQFTTLNGDAVRGTTTRTTQGKEGWIASATNNYDITIYAMLYRNVMSKHGRLAIQDE
jgi:hypothetical protein